MDIQTTFNVAIAIAGFLGGWVLNSIKDSIRELSKTDALMVDKIQAIEVMVAGKYVTYEMLDKRLGAMFTKLDRIEEKLDKKVDKIGVA